MSLELEDIRPSIMLAFGRRSSVLRIQDEVAAFYGIRPDYMRSPDRPGSREPRVSHPRQVAMFLTQKLTRLSTPEIGRRFGGRDHTTVLHAKKAVERRVANDPYLEMELEVLRERLTLMEAV
jgi:chromosomal replication initiator protein